MRSRCRGGHHGLVARATTHDHRPRKSNAARDRLGGRRHAAVSAVDLEGLDGVGVLLVEGEPDPAERARRVGDAVDDGVVVRAGLVVREARRRALGLATLLEIVGEHQLDEAVERARLLTRRGDRDLQAGRGLGALGRSHGGADEDAQLAVMAKLSCH